MKDESGFSSSVLYLFLISFRRGNAADMAQLFEQTGQMIRVLYIDRHFPVEHLIGSIDAEGADIGIVIARNDMGQIADHTGTVFAIDPDADKVIGSFFGAGPFDIDKALFAVIDLHLRNVMAIAAMDLYSMTDG